MNRLLSIMAFTLIPWIAVSNDGTTSTLVIPGAVAGGQDLALDLGASAKNIIVKRGGTLLDAEDSLGGIKSVGSAIIAISHGITTSSVSLGTVFSNATVFLCLINVPLGVTATGVGFFQTTQGNYTASNYNGVGLYSYDGAGILTLIASSTSDGTLWKAANNTMVKKDFTTPVTITAGSYWLAFLYCRSATVQDPAIAFAPAVISPQISSLDLTNNAKTFGVVGGTTLPATQDMAGVSADTGRPFVFLY